MIMVLVVLFLGKRSADRKSLPPLWHLTPLPPSPPRFSDAVREVQKYSGPEPMQDAKVNPNVYDHVHMKLFRAQRNLYISGFSLFLWLSVPPQTASNTLLIMQKWHLSLFYSLFTESCAV